ncbi:MAG: hypothetical protein WBA63_08870 [Thermomicrobiales bacterium]
MVLRIGFTTSRGRVVRYVVQLEIIDDTGPKLVRRPVVRHDAAHGEAHIDHIDPKGVTYDKQWLDIREPYNETFNNAVRDLSENYQSHIERFRTMERRSR